MKTKWLQTFYLVALWLLPTLSFAGVGVGAGYNAATTGRPVPAIYLRADLGNYALTVMGTGVQTTLYYHTAWQSNFFYTWQAGEFLSASVLSGFGLGAYYAKRGYRETVNSTIMTSEDFAAGPAIMVKSTWAGFFFVSIEGMFGLRPSTAHILLSSQDLASVAAGVEF